LVGTRRACRAGSPHSVRSAGRMRYARKPAAPETRSGPAPALRPHPPPTSPSAEPDHGRLQICRAPASQHLIKRAQLVPLARYLRGLIKREVAVGQSEDVARELAARSPNFGFLLPHEPLLVVRGAGAEADLHSDPNGCMVKSRQFVEVLG
jgi:hypothetical protein